MMLQQTTITLYIHPDKGPIMPIQLDMLKIEISVVGQSTRGNRDDARLHAIAKCITDAFPKVQAESRLQDIRVLVSRLAHVSIFDGIVLRLPGIIDGPSQPQNPTIAQFDAMDKEIGTLKTELERVRQDYGSMQVMITTLEDENMKLRPMAVTLNEEIGELRTELQNADIAKYQAKQEVLLYQDQVGQLQQDKAALQVDLDKTRQEIITYQKLQDDVAQYRQQLREEQAANKQLRDTLLKRDKKIQELNEMRENLLNDLDAMRENLLKLTRQRGTPTTPPEPTPVEVTPIDDEDEAKAPWLD